MPRHKKDNKLYFSERLTSLLKGILTARTTLISAPSGYGKTTAVREFFDKLPPRHGTLHWLTCVEEPAFAAWERFCRVIQKMDAPAGNELLAMGLPDDDMRGEVATLLMEMECEEETWLVMDDFQNIRSAVHDTAWNALMEHGAKNLHTVILTRTAIEMRMTKKPGVLYLGQDDMRLTESEIGEYFEHAGVRLAPDQIREVNRNTGGWIIALNLQREGYIKTGAFLHTADIHKMMREIMWDGLAGEERNFLLRVSPFDAYTSHFSFK